MVKLLFSFVTLFASFVAYTQQKAQTPDFSIHLTACFKNNVISVRLNDQNIGADLMVLSTDQSDGITGLNIYQDKTGLWVSYRGKKIKKKKINMKIPLKIWVSADGEIKTFSPDLETGKYIQIDKCGPSKDDNKTKTLQINQSLQSPQFD